MNNFGAHSILPGFRATFAIAVVRLAIMALLPLATPVVNTSTIGFEEASCRVVANGKAADKTACLKAADLGGTRWGGRGIDLSAASVPARACGEPADTAPEQNEEGPERRRNAA